MAAVAQFACGVGQVRVLVENNTLDGTLSAAIRQPIVDFIDSLCVENRTRLLRLRNGLPSAAPAIRLAEALQLLDTAGLGGDYVAPYNPIDKKVCMLKHPSNRFGVMDRVFGAVPVSCKELNRLEIGGWDSTSLLRYEMPAPSRVRMLILRGSRHVVACPAQASIVTAAGFRTQAPGVLPYSAEEFAAVTEFCRANEGIDRILDEGTMSGDNLKHHMLVHVALLTCRCSCPRTSSSCIVYVL